MATDRCDAMRAMHSTMPFTVLDWQTHLCMVTETNSILRTVKLSTGESLLFSHLTHPGDVPKNKDYVHTQ